MQLGHITYAPDYRSQPIAGGFVRTSRSALEAGDSSFVQPSLFDDLMHRPPANDNRPDAKPRIIALTGYAGSGKSTAASILGEQGYVLRKFAGPLKSMLRSLLEQAGLSPREIDRRIEGDLKEQPDTLLLGRTPRQAMQWLGTEWGRGQFGDGFWVGMWAAGLVPSKRYVVDDCRFENEAAAIRERGGVIVRIDRPGVNAVNEHVSEALPVEPDIVITNNGSIADLRRSIEGLAA